MPASGWRGQWLPGADANPNNWWNADDVAEPTSATDFYIDNFSSRAKGAQDLDVAAPGSWVVGPYQLQSGKASYFYLSGNVHASPHVAGIVAMMTQKNPALTAAQAEEILETTAVPVDPGCATVVEPGALVKHCWGEDATGHGLATADAALGEQSQAIEENGVAELNRQSRLPQRPRHQTCSLRRARRAYAVRYKYAPGRHVAAATYCPGGQSSTGRTVRHALAPALHADPADRAKRERRAGRPPETLLLVWRRAEQYDPALGSPAAWLVRIARNRAIDRWRANGRHASRHSTDEHDTASRGGAPDTAVGQGESVTIISAALARLPPEQSELIELAFFEGYTQAELAERCGLPLGTVKSRMRAGLSALRRLFKSQERHS